MSCQDGEARIPVCENLQLLQDVKQSASILSNIISVTVLM